MPKNDRNISQQERVKKQYRLTQDDIETLHHAKETLGLSNETDTLRVGIELLRRIVGFAEEGWSLAVVDQNRTVKFLQMAGLKLTIQQQPIQLRAEPAETKTGANGLEPTS